jgi:hypothetical protein
MTERDIIADPYRPDEQRVVDFIRERTQDQIGGGDDPIGFLLASYNMIMAERSPDQSFMNVVLRACHEADDFHSDRTPYSILSSALSELGEVAQEVAVVMGDSYKPGGTDGVIGEAVDAIASLIDLIYQMRPTITESELAPLAAEKCQKWLAGISEAKMAGLLK